MTKASEPSPTLILAENHDKVIELMNAGKNQVEIAGKFGVGKGIVSYYLNKHRLLTRYHQIQNELKLQSPKEKAIRDSLESKMRYIEDSFDIGPDCELIPTAKTYALREFLFQRGHNSQYDILEELFVYVLNLEEPTSTPEISRALGRRITNYKIKKILNRSTIDLSNVIFPQKRTKDKLRLLNIAINDTEFNSRDIVYFLPGESEGSVRFAISKSQSRRNRNWKSRLLIDGIEHSSRANVSRLYEFEDQGQSLDYMMDQMSIQYKVNRIPMFTDDEILEILVQRGNHEPEIIADLQRIYTPPTLDELLPGKNVRIEHGYLPPGVAEAYRRNYTLS